MFSTVKARHRWTLHMPHANRPGTDMWRATGYLMPGTGQKSKNVSVA